MASNSVKPHVPPEAAPEIILPLLKRLIADKQSFTTVQALREFSADAGLTGRPEVPSFMTNVGLLVQIDGKIMPSQLAKALFQSPEKIQVDIVHYLIYSGWSEGKAQEASDLWGYRQVSDLLWERAPIDVLALTDYLTEEIRNRALILFGEDVSFSPKSIRGVRKWLEVLSPPVLEENRFERRQYVHPQLLLLACGWVGQQTEAETGIDMLLTPARREAICRLCLLEPSALDQTLDWMLPVYPHIVKTGTTSGIYGRFLRFHKWPSLNDLPTAKR